MYAKKWNGWVYIRFNFGGNYLLNKLYVNNRKVIWAVKNEKVRSLRIKNFNFSETILHCPY